MYNLIEFLDQAVVSSHSQIKDFKVMGSETASLSVFNIMRVHYDLKDGSNKAFGTLVCSLDEIKFLPIVMYKKRRLPKALIIIVLLGAFVFGPGIVKKFGNPKGSIIVGVVIFIFLFLANVIIALFNDVVKTISLRKYDSIVSQGETILHKTPLIDLPVSSIQKIERQLYSLIIYQKDSSDNIVFKFGESSWLKNEQNILGLLSKTEQ